MHIEVQQLVNDDYYDLVYKETYMTRSRKSGHFLTILFMLLLGIAGVFVESLVLTGYSLIVYSLFIPRVEQKNGGWS